jgi:SpoVK/Ycf46/Vps4 family AAA+-type ATPase
VKKITAVFAVAKAMAPSIIFINECDAIMRGSSSGAAKYINHFKDTWDTIQNSPVLVMGNTNNPELIDAALRSRLTTKIQFNPPDAESRKVILRNAFKATELTCAISECEWDAIAAATDGNVGRDLLGLVTRVCSAYNRQHRGKEEKPPITVNDIAAKLSDDGAKILQDAIRAPGPSGKRPASVRPEDEAARSDSESSGERTSSSRKRKQPEPSSEAVAPEASNEVKAIVRAIDMFYEVDAEAERIPRKDFFKVIKKDENYVKTFYEDDIEATINTYNVSMNELLKAALKVIATRVNSVTVQVHEDSRRKHWVVGLRPRDV